MALKDVFWTEAAFEKLVSFSFWAGIYTWCSLQYSKHNPEWSSRAVTLLHGTVATVAGLAQCGVTSISKYTLTMEVTRNMYLLMVWSWGYFAFDLLWCIVFWLDNKIMLVHHVVALGAITVYMQKQNTGCVFSCTMALMEISNPLLQIRWFLKNDRQDKTKLYTMVEAGYLILFFTARAIIGTYLIYKIMLSDLFDIEEKLLSFIFYLVGLAFLYDIFGYIGYKYNYLVRAVEEFLDERGIILSHE